MSEVPLDYLLALRGMWLRLVGNMIDAVQQLTEQKEWRMDKDLPTKLTHQVNLEPDKKVAYKDSI
jgi:hypothetical protein